MAIISLGLERIENDFISYIEQIIYSKQWGRFYNIYGDYKEQFVTKFENDFKEFFLRNYAVAVSSGTQALSLAFKALNVSDKEVIVSCYSFSACPHAVINAGGTPVVIPICTNLTLDLNYLRKSINLKTKAILVVHCRGITQPMENIYKIAKDANIAVIEDCSQFDGCQYNEHFVGSQFSDIAIYSFQSRKIISAGEGGIVLTNSRNTYEKIFKLHDPAWNLRKNIDFNPDLEDVWSAGSRMNELTAAVLCYQMNNFKEFLYQVIKNRLEFEEFIKPYVTLLPFESNTERGGTIAIVFEQQNLKQRFVEVFNIFNMGIYPESLSLNDSHYYKGWLKSLKDKCKFPFCLHNSDEKISKVLLMQAPNSKILFKDDLSKLLDSEIFN